MPSGTKCIVKAAKRGRLSFINIEVKPVSADRGHVSGTLGRLICYMCRMNVVTSTRAGRVIFIITRS